MNSSNILSSPRAAEDSELVRAALAGDRDAYEQIVVRYQALLCSLAYSGTGSLARSEDVAQETFVAAWKHLRDLRDPSHLRSWLCGIARNLVGNAHRRAAREPSQIGLPLDSVTEPSSSDASPPDQLMRAEEEAILWRAVGNIPEIYREPLILYYREHRSVEEVAKKLGLTEVATRQRLSRGRAFLQEQVIAIVEGTLERTKPNPAFTSAVIAALPAFGSSATAAIGASTVSKSTVGKAGSALGGAGFAAAVTGLLAMLGGYAGWQMSNSDAQSEAERRWAARFWRIAVVGTGAFLAPAFLVLQVWGHAHAWLLTVLSYYLIAIYAAVAVPFGLWAWQNHRRLRGIPSGMESAGTSLKLCVISGLFLAAGSVGVMMLGFPNGSWTDLWLQLVFAFALMTLSVFASTMWQRRRGAAHDGKVAVRAFGKPLSLAWVAVMTLVMGTLLAPAFATGWRVDRISVAAARELIAQHPEARIHVAEYQSGRNSLNVVVTVAGKPTRFVSPVDAATLAKLRANGVSYTTQKQGRDFEMLGWPGRFSFVVAVFTVFAGVVILVRGLWPAARQGATRGRNET